MSKSAILKFLVCAGFVFLLLPAVFDEEKEPQTPSLAAQATDFNPSEYQGEESLPVLENAPKDNILVRYGKRFKKMYGKAFLSSNEPEESAQVKAASGEDDEDLYFAMAALLDSNTGETRGPLSSYSNDNDNIDSLNMNAIAYANTSAGYVNESSSSIKQTMHDNAPVKGLYETSSVEPYENRTKARQVYSNVMYKVEKNNPRQSAKTAVSAEESSASVQTDSVEGTAGATSSRASNSGKYSSFENGSADLGSGSYSGFDSDSGEKLASAYKGFKKSSKYTGIASPSSSRSSSSRRGSSSGSYSSFRGGNAGSSEDDYYGDLSSQFEVDVNKATEGIGAAKEYLTIEQEKAEAGKTETDNNKNNPEADKTPSEDASNPQPPMPPTPENPDIVSPDKNKPTPKEELLFKPFDENSINTGDVPCDVEPMQVENKEEASTLKELPPPTECANPNPDSDKDAVDMGERGVLLDLGIRKGKDGKDYVVVPEPYAFSSKGLGQIGVYNYVGGSANVGLENFSGIPVDEFKRLADDKNNIIISVSPGVHSQYPDRTVVIENGYALENAEDLKKIAKEVDNILNPKEEEPKPEAQAQPQVQQQSLMYYPQTEKPKPGYGVLKPTDEEIAEDKKKEITGFFGGGADFWPWKK